MKENFTSINVVIDQSGSMAGLVDETISGYNEFLRDQKKLPDEAIMTLCLFSNKYEIVHNCVKLADVPELTDQVYKPAGMTALLDAIGRTVDDVGNTLSTMKEEERPSKVLFLIITDGHENSSKEYKAKQIKDKIEHQKSNYKWEFIFLGADLSSLGEAADLGVSQVFQYQANSVGVRDMYLGLSKGVATTRSTGSSFVYEPKK